MEGIIFGTARLVRASQRAYVRKWSFLALSVCVFIANILLLAKLDLLPEAPKAQVVATVPTVTVSATSTAPVVVAPETPVKIAIPSIGLTATVANPMTTNAEVLDNALLAGAVRYPTSGKLGQDNANVVIFGHSSYLPIVHNQAYKTFDGIQKLHAGDTISVYSAGAVYTYAVDTVSKESAAQDAGIPLQVSGKLLTLSTCDSFGEKTDRFVVTAHFVESHSNIAS